MLTAGSTKARDLWFDVLEGRRHTLLHGYYCTRQLDDAERAEGISSSEARIREANFFATTTPWATSSFRERFGTPNLVKTLSGLLVTIINDTCVFLFLKFCDSICRLKLPLSAFQRFSPKHSPSYLAAPNSSLLCPHRSLAKYPHRCPSSSPAFVLP